MNTGLQDSDIVLIASDLSKMVLGFARSGRRFDPDAFIDRLKEQFKNGTILIPAFTNPLKTGNAFDQSLSVPETGTLSVAAFKRKDFSRTSDPFHSFMVWGKNSGELCNLKPESTFGNDSVFAWLYNQGAKMMLIDIDLQHSFTFAHYVEELEKVPYRKFRSYNINCTDKSGKKENRKILFYEKKIGVMLNMQNLDRLLLKEGAASQSRMEGSCYTIIDLKKSFDILRKDIHSNRAANLQKWNLILYLKTLLKKLIV